MKTVIAVLGLVVMGGSVNGQSITNALALARQERQAGEMRALVAAAATNLSVAVTTNGSSVTYAVTLPVTTAARLKEAMVPGESEEAYVRRAFCAGVCGLAEGRWAVVAAQRRLERRAVEVGLGQ